jgi:hypothetical protein
MNGSQQWIFLCFRTHVIAGWLPSHTLSTPSEDLCVLQGVCKSLRLLQLRVISLQ